VSLKDKLTRLKPHISGSNIIEQLPVELPNTSKIDFPHREKWEKENVFPFFFDENYCLIREVKYPLSERHGKYCFQDFLTAVEIWNTQKVKHPLSADGYRAEELFFFDTETTGLGGGVGNTIFLLGYASVSKGELILRQHILPHPGAEVPLYQSFLEKVNYRTLITYNGKSFDWPQVKTRHTLVREHVPKLPAFGHFDLYHASRRLWRHRLDKLKLSIVEKEILGVDRVGDIPGYLAPMIYFDFVESKQPEGMLGVLKHNEIDILSLITLYTHITYQICGHDHSRTRNETFEIGRWFASLGEKTEANQAFIGLVDGNDKISDQAKMELAYHFKKEHEWDYALGLFKEVAHNKINEKLFIEACIEIAKILEHKHNNYDLAIKYCKKAIGVFNQSLINQNHQSLLLGRLKRLENKRKKFPG
jgi:uncharacterized protein